MTEIASPLANRSRLGPIGRRPCSIYGRGTAIRFARSALAPLLLVLFGVHGTAAAPVNAPALMGRLQARYRSMRTLKVKFEQVFRSPVAEQRESGVLYFRRPNRMRWEYLLPKAKLFVLDGKKTYFYVPEDRQVSVSQWREESAALPLLFLLGERDAARDFQIVEAEGAAPLAGGDVVLRLTPRTEQSEIKEVLVEGHRDRNEIVRLSILEHGGNQNDYLFSAPEPNARISDELFKFRIPKGVEVLEAEP